MTAPDAESRPDTVAKASGMTGGATLLAERAVLAALLHLPERMADLDRWLRAGDFADPQHAAVYSTIAGLRAAGELHPISRTGSGQLGTEVRLAKSNILAVQQALQSGRFAPAIPPHVNVRELVGRTPSTSAGPLVRYGQMVLASSTRRRMQTWGLRLETAPDAALTQGYETRDLAAEHDALLDEFDDLQRRSAQSTVSREITALTRSSEMASTPRAGSLVVPAAAPAPKLVERAERDVISAVLSDETGQHNQVRDHLAPDDFTASPRHAATWRAIQEVAQRGEPVNAITVAWETEHLPTELDPALSADELVALSEVQSPRSLRRQTSTIARASMYHRVRHAAGQLVSTAQDRARSTDELLTGARNVVKELRDQATRLADEHAPAATRGRIAQSLDGQSEPALRQR